jgi:hypothetical protein
MNILQDDINNVFRSFCIINRCQHNSVPDCSIGIRGDQGISSQHTGEKHRFQQMSGMLPWCALYRAYVQAAS